MAGSDSDEVEMEEVTAGGPIEGAQPPAPELDRAEADEDEEEDSDEEMEWDEVVGQQAAETSADGLATAEQSLEESRALHDEDEEGAEQTEEGEGYKGVKIGQDDKAPINIVLEQVKKGKKLKKRTANSAIERTIRHETHRAHTLCLLYAGLIRNRLLNEPLVQARLLSLVPLRLVNAFHSFTPSTHPNERDRSRLFDAALRDLVSWWWQTFDIDDSVDGVKLRTWAEAEAMYTLDSSLASSPSKDVKGKGKAKATKPQDPFEALLESGEPVHSCKSLSKRAVLRRGSRDMSAQLFCALLRAMDVPARLVFSLQPVTWRGAGGGGRAVEGSDDETEEAGDSSSTAKTPPNKGKGKGKAAAKGKKAAPKSLAAARPKKKPQRGELATKAMKAAKAIKARSGQSNLGTMSESHTATAEEEDDSSDDEDDFEPVPIPSSSRAAARAGISGDGSSSRPVSVPGSDTDDTAQRMSWLSAPAGKASTKAPPVKLRRPRPPKTPQRNWAKSPSPGPEELSRPPVWWVEVYSRPAKEWFAVDVTRKRMRCKNIMEPAKSNPENRMLYVVAYEEDGYIRDVTAKYSHSYGGTTVKQRLPSRKGTDWFADATTFLKRPYRLTRDEKEDIEIERAQTSEAMPTTVTGFKDHPNFALERHLRREEVIHPRRQLGNFRGEAVFPRSSVISLKSADNFMREGRRIKAGEQPLKMVKARVVTINRKREQAAAEAEGQEAPQQALYAEWQSELLIPPPIKDGHIPRNAYGNMDLFAPHMLPRGAVHLPYKGIAKIAKQLEVSFAEAITGFEFHKRRAIPVVEGIVVAQEVKDLVWETYWSSEEAAMEKAMTKVQERCLKRWKKLIVGLRIRQRVQDEYKHQLQKAERKNAHPKEGPSELRDLRPDEAKEEIVPRAAAAVQELYTDHHLNALSMPKPSKPDYVNGHKRKHRASDDESDSDPDQDDNFEDEEEDVKPVASSSKKTAAPNGKVSPAKKAKTAGGTRVSVRIPSLPKAKAKAKTASADTPRTRSLRSRAEE